VAKFTNVSGELRFVNHGLRATVAVPADGDLEIPDDDEVVAAYACQPDVWAAADDVAKNAAVRQAQAATDAQAASEAAAQADAEELSRLDAEVAAQTAADEAAAAATDTDDDPSKG
jgi:hypothetical protein